MDKKTLEILHRVECLTAEVRDLRALLTFLIVATILPVVVPTDEKQPDSE